uniref:Myb-like domain-containing protein n=1 Tax=Araucaria cunninghamii TaxID=56994 RepID=A0A0D6R0X5_ARACU
MSSANLGAAMAAPATNSLAVICVSPSVKQEAVVNLAAQPLSARAPPAENGGGGAAHQEALVVAAAEAEEEKKHKKRSKNWTRLETLRLIRLRAELEPRFARTGRKSELWDEISESLRSENISRDAQQCRDKWEKLTAGYKEVRDGLRDRADNPFFEELDPLLSVKSAKKSDPRDREPAPPVANFNGGSNGAKVVNGTDDEETAEEHEEEEERPPAKRRRGGEDFVTAAGLGAMRELLESLVSRQQKFFVELLDSMERKEQIREQIRQEKEEKWRAEDRAQRCVFHNAMIVLTRKLLEAEGLGFEPVPAPRHQHPHFGCGGGAAPAPGGGGGGGGGVKKRSKNWKRAEVLQLIKFRAEMEGRFAKSTRRAALWEELAELLGAEGIKRDGKQCREKWDKLMAEYKDVSDGKRDRSESPYFAELTSMIGRPAEAG